MYCKCIINVFYQFKIKYDICVFVKCNLSIITHKPGICNIFFFLFRYGKLISKVCTNISKASCIRISNI